MGALSTLDLVILVTYLAATLAVGMFFARGAGKSAAEFFVAGRSLPWWLLGISMAATNFSIDTPLSVTKFVSKEGIAGVWFWWGSALSGLFAAFLFSRLWRRSGVVTDAEIVELRYSGRAAAALRVFKGGYFGILFNLITLGWVFRALYKVAFAVTGADPTWILIAATLFALIYTLASGIYGVVITDFFQYGIAAVGAIVVAAYSVQSAGGLTELVRKTEQTNPAMLDFVPSGDGATLPMSVFLTYLLMKWWAHKWADGGGKHIQRMLSAKDESHALRATVFFAFNCVLVVWPWVLTALAAHLRFGDVPDPEMNYPRIMAEVLPSGVLGLCLACLVGAFMSTIDTHLNLGASYVVNDLYRRFLVKDRNERHYVFVARIVMVLFLVGGVVVSFFTDSIADTWKFLVTFASGAGLTWIVRWFWWRANAWTEFAGMLASGLIATGLSYAGPELLFSHKMWITVGISTPVWLVVTWLTPPVDEPTLLRFAERVRPGRLGWRRVYEAGGFDHPPYLVRALTTWFGSTVSVFCASFTVGALLLGRSTHALAFLVASALIGYATWWFHRTAPSGEAALGPDAPQ